MRFGLLIGFAVAWGVVFMGTAQGAPVVPCPDFAAEEASPLLAEVFDPEGFDTWIINLYGETVCSSGFSFSAEASVRYSANLAAIQQESFAGQLSSIVHLAAAILSCNTELKTMALGFMSNFGTPAGTYEALSIGGVEIFTQAGDLDGDGLSNVQEYTNVRSFGRGGYGQWRVAVLDPELTGKECTVAEPAEFAVDELGQTLYSVLGSQYETDDIDYDGVADKFQIHMIYYSLVNINDKWHAETVCAYNWNLGILRTTGPMYSMLNHYYEWIALAVATSSGFRDTWRHTAGVSDDYHVVTSAQKAANEPFSAEGDFDGDGNSNVAEYLNAVENNLSVDEYVTVARSALMDGTQPLSAMPLSAPCMAALVFVMAALSRFLFRKERRVSESGL